MTAAAEALSGRLQTRPTLGPLDIAKRGAAGQTIRLGQFTATRHNSFARKRMLKVIAANASVELPAGIRAHSHVWSSRQLLAAAALLVALAAAALLVDTTIARFVKERNVPGELRRLVRLSEVFGWGGSVALVIATAAMLDPRGWRVVLPLVIPAFGAGALADGVKLLVVRMRPSATELAGSSLASFGAWLPLVHRDELGQNYGYALQSFPSAHAATAAGLAVGLAALYPRGRWLFAIFAVLAGLQRVEAQAHFLSDVLIGAAIGCLVGAASGRFFRFSREFGEGRASSDNLMGR
jgi:membrane-associated phospholipid phosphatase